MRRPLLDHSILSAGGVPINAGTGCVQGAFGQEWAVALDDFHYLEISELARLIAARKVSPVELTEAMLRRIERVDPGLKSYALVTPDLALTQARAAEQMIDGTSSYRNCTACLSPSRTCAGLKELPQR